MDPRKKKRQSLKHDSKNDYGKNDKSSRKAIAFRKRWINHVNRRRMKTSLLSMDYETGEVLKDRNAVRRWKKWRDVPLGKYLHRRAVERLLRNLQERYQQDEGLLYRMQEHLLSSGCGAVETRLVIRRLDAKLSYYGSVRNRDLYAIRREIIERIADFLTTSSIFRPAAADTDI